MKEGYKKHRKGLGAGYSGDTGGQRTGGQVTGEQGTGAQGTCEREAG